MTDSEEEQLADWRTTGKPIPCRLTTAVARK